MKNNVSNWVVLISLFLTVQSCIGVKNYERPTEAVNEAFYRTDQLPTDSISIADFTYKEIFTDPQLQALLDQAMQNNLDVRVAMQNIEVADAYLKQAKNAYFPTLSVGPNYTFSTQSLNTQFGRIIGERVYINQFDITANSSWEADIWGKLKSSEKESYASYLQSVAGHQAVKSQIVSAIASAYYQLLSLDEQKRTTQNNIEIREKSLETTEALKTAGVVTEVAVKQSQAQLLNFKASLVTLDNSIVILENQICYLLGESSHPIERGTLENQDLPEELKVGFPASLLRNRPDVMMAEQSLVQAFELNQVAKKSLYPSLTLGLSTGLQSIDIGKLFNGHSLFASLAAGIAQPIFQQRRLKTQVEVTQIQQEQALNNFKNSVLFASQEVSNALQTYNSQDQIIDLKTQEYQSYETAREYSQELLNYGMANYLEVLTAQENALNAQLAAINAKYAKLNALVQLYAALGGGWK